MIITRRATVSLLAFAAFMLGGASSARAADTPATVADIPANLRTIACHGGCPVPTPEDIGFMSQAGYSKDFIEVNAYDSRLATYGLEFLDGGPGVNAVAADAGDPDDVVRTSSMGLVELSDPGEDANGIASRPAPTTSDVGEPCEESGLEPSTSQHGTQCRDFLIPPDTGISGPPQTLVAGNGDQPAEQIKRFFYDTSRGITYLLRWGTVSGYGYRHINARRGYNDLTEFRINENFKQYNVVVEGGGSLLFRYFAKANNKCLFKTVYQTRILRYDDRPKGIITAYTVPNTGC